MHNISIVGRIDFGQFYREIATFVGLAQGRSSTHVCITNRMGPWSDVAFWCISPKCQCPKTAVFGQNGRFSDSAYYRHPEAEPDIEGGLTVKNESLF